MYSAETKATKTMAQTVQDELKGKDQKFESVIVPFLAESERTLKHLEDLFKETCSLFMEVLLWFGWPEAKVQKIRI